MNLALDTIRYNVSGPSLDTMDTNLTSRATSATERCMCKCRVTLLLRDVDYGQTDHMAAEPTHGPHHSCSSSSWLGARGPFLTIAQY